MSKYNITENKQQRPAAYRTTVSPEVMDELQRKVIQKIVVEKCYRDKNYSARQLAQDLGTNTRYISAVVNNRFHKNYTELVNGYRVEEAMSLMVDRRYQKTNIEDISAMVGFQQPPELLRGLLPLCRKDPASVSRGGTGEARHRHHAQEARSQAQEQTGGQRLSPLIS